MAFAATVVLPTESVVLISMSCWKISRESFLVGASSWAKAGTVAAESSRQQTRRRSRPAPATTKGIEFLFSVNDQSQQTKLRLCRRGTAAMRLV
jgi:hypothetical protein